MKKIALVVASLLAVSGSAIAIKNVFASEPEPTSVKTAAELFEEYYNGGVYTRENAIYLPEDVDDVFHGPVVTEKTTYFDGKTLWMSTNSGYTSEALGEEEDLLHFALDDDNKMVNVVSYGKLGDIDHFFVTMKDFVEDTDTSEWTAIEGGYETTDAETLEAVMAFAASCFTNEGDFVTLERAEIKEEDNKLYFYLYITEEGVTTGVDKLLARTSVEKGVGDFVINE